MEARNIWIGLFLTLVIIGGVFYYFQSFEVRYIAQQATDAFENGNFQEAQVLFQQALEKHANDPVLLANLVKSFASEGNRTGKERELEAKAEPFAKQALEADPDNVEVLLAVGYLAETNGRYEEALGYYGRARQLYPDSSMAQFHYGHTLEFLGRKTEAEAAYVKSLELDPKNSLALIAKGRSRFFEGNYEEASVYFLQAAGSSSSASLQSEALAGAALAKRNQGYFKEAKEFAQQAVEKDPTFVLAKLEYGMGQAMEGDLEGGVKTIYEAIQLNTRAVQPFWSMGIVLRSGKYFTESIEFLTAGLARVANDNTLVGPQAKNETRSQMTYDLAKTYDIQGNSGKALEFLEQAIQIDGNLSLYLQRDVEEHGFFKALETNGRFRALLP
ncbi:MAG: tetratricopeptide repeat protein [bacterium]|nr:tetratricopeptide repeat protein [bacterium]